jgi:hypothetical protein
MTGKEAEDLLNPAKTIKRVSLVNDYPDHHVGFPCRRPIGCSDDNQF